MDNNSVNDICILREKIARLEERIIASDKALELARGALSKNSVLSIITIIISIIAVVVVFFKK